MELLNQKETEAGAGSGFESKFGNVSIDGGSIPTAEWVGGAGSASRIKMYRY